MRSQTRKTAIRLALGIVLGVVLVLLPGVLSTGTSNPASSSTTTTQCSDCPGSFATVPTVSSNQAPGRLQSNGGATDGVSLLMIILFVFLPSTLLSLFVRRIAEKRGNQRLSEEAVL